VLLAYRDRHVPSLILSSHALIQYVQIAGRCSALKLSQKMPTTCLTLPRHQLIMLQKSICKGFAQGYLLVAMPLCYTFVSSGYALMPRLSLSPALMPYS
jgi:hypothetical protein